MRGKPRIHKKQNRAMRTLVCGFTVIELLVSTSIILLISGVILARFPSFSSKIVLSTLAHEVALSIRQAQVFGTSAREFGTDKFPSQGIFFETANPTQFVLFADTNPNKFYDIADGIVDTFTIENGSSIKSLCAPVENCVGVTELHIVFTRPNPDASIKDSGGGVYSSGQITIQSSRGDTRLVRVWANGQIAVQ